MERTRPDPDKLLSAAKEEEKLARRGALKIFFGATAGVGKTYAMLEAGQKKRSEGANVVVGVVETHRRVETERLLTGLDVLPRASYAYRGVKLDEFDLDAAIKRKPQIILLDELAHTNAPGSWHAKRWQDALELLEAGIDVYTTLNVQHLESVNDIVAKITGVLVRETVPDSIFDRSDEVELVDLTPDDLLQRLAEGKVYFSEQAERAVENFFAKGNLIALRELALRRAADRVEAQMESFRRLHAARESWPVSERILVAVSPSPYARRVVRAAWRMASRLRAEWIVAYVESSTAAQISKDDRDRVIQTLRLAEELGAQTVTLTAGENVAAELVKYALERNVNKIVVGKPGRPHWRDRVFGSMVDDLIRNEAGIDVYVIRGQLEEVARSVPQKTRKLAEGSKYLTAVGIMALCTLVAEVLSQYYDQTSIALIFVLGIVSVALLCGSGPSFLASVLAVMCFDFFFVPPYYKFTVFDYRSIFTFIVIFLVGNVIANLTLRSKRQAEIARRHDRLTAALYQLTRDLAAAHSKEEMVECVERNLSTVSKGQVAVLLPDGKRRIASRSAEKEAVFITPWRLPVAQWVMDHGKPAGLGTDTLPSSDSLFLPMNAGRGTVGVIAVSALDQDLVQNSDQMLLLETLARNAAMAFEQLELVSEADKARMQAQAEHLQNTLLSSVSHDLRTPLASITGAASILTSDAKLDDDKRRELLSAIHHEADRLNRLVTNLLNMTRLETGALSPDKDWQSVEELVGAALNDSENVLQGFPVITRVPPNLPLVHVDGLMIEQVFVNILDNAVKYTPAGSPIEIEARVEGPELLIAISDRGPGFAPGDEDKVFEKFYRGSALRAPEGAGLGLAICRGFVEVHGGRIGAGNRPGGGAVFEIRLPLESKPPEVSGAGEVSADS